MGKQGVHLFNTAATQLDAIVTQACDADKPKEAAVEEQAAAKPSAAFWEDLLRDGYTEFHEVQQATLGKGKRERRQVCLQCYPVLP